MKAKICGMTTLKDAQMALEAGADFIGIIFCKASKRYVDPKEAKAILSALSSYREQIVGVFLDEPIQSIAQVAHQLNLKWVQLLAPKTKEQLSPIAHLNHILVLQVDELGKYNPLTYEQDRGYILYDGIKAGSGKPFNWSTFYPQEHRPFFIAGGLKASSIDSVFKRFEPDGVDVATHVCYPQSQQKDPEKVIEFIQKAHHAK